MKPKIIKNLVSVIINCHNSEKYLKEAIDSVIAQTFDNWEVIIWDNFSTDNTLKICHKYKDQRIKVHSSKKFTSLGQARNLALNKIQGEFVCFLDSDDLWMREKLAKQHVLFSDQKVGMVICNTFFLKNGKIIKKLYKTPPKEGYIFRELLKNYNISLETVMIRTDALFRLDYIFDNRLEVTEEYDLLLRISENWKLMYVNDVLAKWRIHESNRTFSKSNLFPLERKIVLENLSKSIKNFEENYENEIYSIKRIISYENSLEYLKNGNPKKARIEVKEHIKNNFKFFLYYLLTFIPYSLFKMIIKLKRGFF